MSQVVSYQIPCPRCKEISEHSIFHSLNTNIEGAVHKILNDEINFVSCKICNNKFQIKTSFLFNNMKKSYAVYYNPVSFEKNEQESEGLKRMLGKDIYLATPNRYNDWDLFKQDIRRKEGLPLSSV